MEAKPSVKTFMDLLLRHRWGVILCTLAVTAVMTYLSLGLTTNNDYETWLPEKDRVSTLYRETDKEFSSNALVFACLEFKDKGVFHPESLREIQRLTKVFESVPELFNVTTLTNVMDIRPIEDGISVEKLVEEIPQDPEELAHLKKYVLSKEMYVNTLVSQDTNYTVMLMNIDGDYDEVEVAKKVMGLLDKHARGVSYYFGGDPAIAYYTDIYMQRDMRVLLPITLVMMILVLGFGLRRFWGIVLPLLVVILCILWTFGLQRVFHMPLNLITPAVMVLLIAMGSDYAVHAINHSMQSEEVGRAGAEISLPIIMSALTTIAGLATFATTKIKILKDFGFELAFGLGTACLLSLTFLVVLLRILPIKAKKASSQGEAAADHPYSRLLEGLTLRVIRHHRLFLGVVFVILVIMGIGITRIHTNVDYVTFLPDGSPPRQGHEILKEHFGGVYPLSLYLRGDLQEPSLLALQIHLENYLRSHQQLSGFSSIASLIAEMNRDLTGVYAVPETRSGVASLWLLMEGEPLLKTIVNEARDKGLVSCLMRDSDTGVMRELAYFVRAQVPPGTVDEMITLDPEKLSREGHSQVQELRFTEAAQQIAWLAAGYSEGGSYPVDPLVKKIKGTWPEVQGLVGREGIWVALKDYLHKEAVVLLEESLVQQCVDAFKRHFDRDPLGTWLPQLTRDIGHKASLKPDEATALTESALWRCQETLRLERMRLLARSALSLLPGPLVQNTHFVQRAEGVIWELLSDRPVFLKSSLPQDLDVEKAIIGRVKVEIDQTGAPDIFRRFDELLIQSQIQSLILATVVVLFLVSLAHRSFTRGLLSVLAILAPLDIMLGLMGWAGIPLDVGTVLFGALIIGLGIDGGIHLLYFEAQIQKEGVPPEEAFVKSIRHVGRAILTANATTVAGFLALIFSASKALQNFALINAAAIALVTASILTLLPALLKAARLLDSDPSHSARRAD